MKPEGWINLTPFLTRLRIHYFDVKGVSLCGKWKIQHHPTRYVISDDRHNKHNCALCVRLLNAIEAKEMTKLEKQRELEAEGVEFIKTEGDVPAWVSYLALEPIAHARTLGECIQQTAEAMGD